MTLVSNLKDIFITITFRLCFGIWHLESVRKLGENRTEWDTSDSYVCMFCLITRMQYINKANRYSKNMENFEYLRMTLTNQSFILKEIKSRLNSVNACYHSVQNLPHHLESKNSKIITVPIVMYGCENLVSDINLYCLGNWIQYFGGGRQKMLSILLL
jgi:hypothetical protein